MTTYSKMKKLFFLLSVWAPFFILTSCGKYDGGFNSLSRNNPKELSATGSVTDITPFGATISGWANIDPALTVAAKFGVIVSENSNPSYSNGMQYSSYELKSDNSYQVEVEDLTPGTKYYYLSYVRIGDIYTYGDVRSFSTKEVYSCPDNHHPHAIDLGLPSGTKWACCNVGATAPEDYGGYYAWGETSEKSEYGWETYKWCNGTNRSLTKYCANSQYGMIDGKTVLDLSDDVAHMRMGNLWRMPTIEQIQELNKYCIWKWTQQNGVNGRLVTGYNGAQVFLPAPRNRRDADGNYFEEDLGVYWSSSIGSDDNSNACVLFFGSLYWEWYATDKPRSGGNNVRAVCP